MLRAAGHTGTLAGTSAPAASEPQSSGRRDDLVQKGLGVVRRIAFRLARRLPPNVDVGDLISAGTEGLLRSLEGFDETCGVKFETYAAPRIHGAIIDELRSNDALTRHARRQFSGVSRAIKKLERDLGRAPEEAEIAQALGMGLESYQRLTEALSRGPALQNLGGVDPDDVSAGDELVQQIEERDVRRMLVEAVKRLPERNQRVLALYYQEECTLAEIGEVLGVSESRICQILGDTTARLRAMFVT